MTLNRCLPILLLSASPLAMADGGTPTASTPLDPIVVTPRADPFDESMQRLRKSMEDPACRGCPPELRAYRKSVYEQFGDAIGFITGVGMDPPKLSPSERTQMRIRNEWRKAEWGPEMDDFR